MKPPQKEKAKKNHSQLLEMLLYKRPAGSKTEKAFIEKYLDVIPGMYADAYGNRILNNPDSKVIIACHTDTVHRDGGMQQLQNRKGIVSLAIGSPSNCLGADDTAGVYAALKMIEAGVPATFIFHRNEEAGGRGSQWLADHYPGWLATFDICLSLDRKGEFDIITSQWGGECASTEFADSLSDALDMGHAPAAGMFTDSANYTHLIPECSNLSVGYANEHTTKETLDIHYLDRLISRLISVDWSKLIVAREPGAKEEEDPLCWLDEKFEFVDEEGYVHSRYWSKDLPRERGMGI